MAKKEAEAIEINPFPRFAVMGHRRPPTPSIRVALRSIGPVMRAADESKVIDSGPR